MELSELQMLELSSHLYQKNTKKLADQIVIKTAVYRRPIHKLSMLLAMDEVWESCQLSQDHLPTKEFMKILS